MCCGSFLCTSCLFIGHGWFTICKFRWCGFSWKCVSKSKHLTAQTGRCILWGQYFCLSRHTQSCKAYFFQWCILWDWDFQQFYVQFLLNRQHPSALQRGKYPNLRRTLGRGDQFPRQQPRKEMITQSAQFCSASSSSWLSGHVCFLHALTLRLLIRPCSIRRGICLLSFSL